MPTETAAPTEAEVAETAKTSVDEVNAVVADMGINASVSSLPKSHHGAQVVDAANDLAAEAEATTTNNSNGN